MKIKYYVVCTDDAERYNLTDKETIVYSVIKGFSQDGVSAYDGGQAELANAARCSKATINRVLASLSQKGIIKSEQDVFLKTRYRAVITESQNETRESQNETRYESQNETHNITIIKEDNKKEIYKEKRFVRPTIEEVSSYCLERGNTVNPEAFLAFYDSNGWKVGKNPMKDWRAAIRTWEQKEKSNGQSTSNTSSAVTKMQQRHAETNAAIIIGANTDTLGF